MIGLYAALFRGENRDLFYALGCTRDDKIEHVLASSWNGVNLHQEIIT